MSKEDKQRKSEDGSVEVEDAKDHWEQAAEICAELGQTSKECFNALYGALGRDDENGTEWILMQSLQY